tara:strand:+ start:85 stop:276 length:192 start_codon:yes stop_codon:yes gene_type:complete
MNEEILKKEVLLSAHIKIENLNRKLSIAITGLKAIISNNSDTLNIAQKTLDELEKVDLPRKEL